MKYKHVSTTFDIVIAPWPPRSRSLLIRRHSKALFEIVSSPQTIAGPLHFLSPFPFTCYGLFVCLWAYNCCFRMARGLLKSSFQFLLKWIWHCGKLPSWLIYFVAFHCLRSFHHFLPSLCLPVSTSVLLSSSLIPSSFSYSLHLLYQFAFTKVHLTLRFPLIYFYNNFLLAQFLFRFCE